MILYDVDLCFLLVEQKGIGRTEIECTDTNNVNGSYAEV